MAKNKYGEASTVYQVDVPRGRKMGTRSVNISDSAYGRPGTTVSVTVGGSKK